MAVKDIGGNIRRFLKLKKFSIANFSKECGIGSATLSNILNGKSSPNSTTLLKIAQTLGVSFNDLLADSPELKTLRFRTNKKLSAREIAQRDQIIIGTTQWLKNYVELENMTGHYNTFLFDNIKTNDPIEAAHKVRELSNLSPDEPIQDIISLIEKSGIKVYLHPFNFQKTFGLSINKEDGGPAIVVNTDDSITLERRIFTIAHELGHLILHSTSFNGKVEEENNKEETEADTFASELLVPQQAFEDKLKEYKGLPWYEAVLQIKKYFLVSYRTILYRLKNIPGGKFYNDDKIFVKFSQIYNEIYKHNLQNHFEPNPLESDSSPARIEVEELANLPFTENRYYSLVREAYENTKISISRAAELLNISMLQMRGVISAWL